MYYKQYGDKTVVRLDKDDEIIESIKTVASELSIKTAFFSAIGATDDFTVGVFDLEKGDYERFSYSGNHEILDLSGNITSADNKPYVHAHITCAGKGGNTVGGHLLNAKISRTLEMVIISVDAEVTREYDASLGINRLSF